MPGSFDLYVTMLFTYQGMGNLVTLTAPGNPTSVYANSLIDYGTTSITECSDTADWIYNYLTGNGAHDAQLDLVVISHKDHDHWSLFPGLLKRLADNGRNLIIQRLAYGGIYTTYRNINKTGNILDNLYQCIATKTPDNYVSYGPEQSAYAALGALAPMRAYLGAGGVVEVKIQPVAVNVRASVNRPDIVANTVSLVAAVVYQDTSILLPGDATADTIEFINKLVLSGRASEIDQPRALSVPHHGALRTIASNYDSSSPELKVAEEFAKSVSPWTVGASAGFATHHHPDYSVMQIFDAYVDINRGAHYFVAYSRAKAAWEAYYTKHGLFTTYLTVGTDGKKLGADKRRLVFRVRADGRFGVLILNPGSGGLAAAALATP